MLRQKLKAAHYPCGVQIVHNSKNKNLRILEAFEARLAARAFAVHHRVTKTPFLDEMRAFQPATPHNQDDGLDAVAGALSQIAPRFAMTPTYTQPEEEL